MNVWMVISVTFNMFFPIKCLIISLNFPKRDHSTYCDLFWMHVHSGIVWRDKIMETGVKYMWKSRSIYYQISTFYTTKNEISPFYIKHINLNVCCHISCPSNKGFARLDPGFWKMANTTDPHFETTGFWDNTSTYFKTCWTSDVNIHNVDILEMYVVYFSHRFLRWPRRAMTVNTRRFFTITLVVFFPSKLHSPFFSSELHATFFSGMMQ